MLLFKAYFDEICQLMLRERESDVQYWIWSQNLLLASIYS